MQGGEGGDGDDLLRQVPPNLEIGLEDLDEGVDQASQVVGSTTRQKPMSANRMHHGVRKGQEIPLISNLKEHAQVLHCQDVIASNFFLSFLLGLAPLHDKT